MTTTMTRSVPPQPLVNLINPLVRTVLRSPMHGLVDSALVLLHVVGRRTGRQYDIPVGYVHVDDELVVITQHHWRVNCRDCATVEVTYQGHRLPMHAHLVEGAPEVAAVLVRIQKRTGSKAMLRATGLRTKPPRTPTLPELESAVRQFDMACLVLTPSPRD